MTTDSEPSTDIEKLHARVTQLEGTARVAHVQLRETIAEQDAGIEAQQKEIPEVRRELSDAREEIRRLEQMAVVNRQQAFDFTVSRLA